MKLIQIKYNTLELDNAAAGLAKFYRATSRRKHTPTVERSVKISCSDLTLVHMAHIESHL